VIIILVLICKYAYAVPYSYVGNQMLMIIIITDL